MSKKSKLREAPQSNSTEQRLFKYVLTAGAGMLAASTPADAAPIYIDAPDQVYTNTNFALDLNNDSVPDVSFLNTVSGGGSFSIRNLRGQAPGAGGIAGHGYASKASALSASANVGPENLFYGTAKLAYGYRSVYYTWGTFGYVGGPWANVTDRYLGLRFLIGPNTHYGWVRMDVSANWWPSVTISATVKDWAYESIPNRAIHTGTTPGEIPEPGTLSLVALGAAGLAAWRRRTRRNA